MNKVVMAYCGGLNTSLCLHWLRHQKGLKVIAFIADMGQGVDHEKVGEQAIALGAHSVRHADLKEVFANSYILPAFQASAQSEGGYLLSTALSRPLLIRELVKIALEEGCPFISHGASEYSNDQLRFETGVSSLAPHLRVIAPNREWFLQTTEEKIRYAKRYDIPFNEEESKDFHQDMNLWGRRVEGGVLRDPAEEAPDEYFSLTRSPKNASPTSVDFELFFKSGAPYKIDHREMNFMNIIRFLNRLGGRHGIGRIDVIENKLLGNKAREIYEAPGAQILTIAHHGLEELTLSQETLYFKAMISKKYTEIIYRGQWFSDLKGALDAFFGKIQTYVTGSIKLRLYRGTCTIIGRKSKYSLYDQQPAQERNQDFMKIFVNPSLAEAIQKRQ